MNDNENGTNGASIALAIAALSVGAIGGALIMHGKDAQPSQETAVISGAVEIEPSKEATALVGAIRDSAAKRARVTCLRGGAANKPGIVFCADGDGAAFLLDDAVADKIGGLEGHAEVTVVADSDGKVFRVPQ